MFNVELFNRTTRTVISQKKVHTESEVAEVVLEYEGRAKDLGEVLLHRGYDTFPSGRIRGACLETSAGEVHVTTTRQ